MPEKLGQRRIREAVEAAMGVKLSSEERALLDGRLRLNGGPGCSQQEVADQIGVSQPHVSNIERVLLKKLFREAEQRQDGRTLATELHDRHAAIQDATDALGRALPPKPLKPLKLRLKKPPS